MSWINHWPDFWQEGKFNWLRTMSCEWVKNFLFEYSPEISNLKHSGWTRSHGRSSMLLDGKLYRETNAVRKLVAGTAGLHKEGCTLCIFVLRAIDIYMISLTWFHSWLIGGLYNFYVLMRKCKRTVTRQIPRQ